MRYFDENVTRLDYVGLSSLPLLFVDCLVESGVEACFPGDASLRWGALLTLEIIHSNFSLFYETDLTS
ncbi:MAG: hypothetical protein OEV89_09280 [Desulfobulbaceae bacterium]|nr:hypothetical protein [Desulfobulbaceae bacterium]HIJ90883.1 hypothetical protein [Deltaproteobacteria bacterium]